MSNSVDFIADTLKKLVIDVAAMKKAIDELREGNTMSAKSADDMYRALNLKLDLLQNLDVKSTAAIAQAAEKKVTKPSRPMFFKSIFNEDRSKYLDVLYSQADVDAVLADERVTKTKAGTTQSNRIATLVYNEHVKVNPDRMSAFEKIYAKQFSA